MLRFRIIAFFACMAIFSVSFQIGAMSQVSMDEANEFVQDFLSQTLYERAKRFFGHAP